MVVYFIRAGENGPVKIGRAGNLAHRLAALQTGHYERLTVLRTAPGGRAEEYALHHKFRALRRLREWFDYSPEMLTVDVASLTSSAPIEPVFIVSTDTVAAAAVHAIKAAGGAVKLAKHLNITRFAVYPWRFDGIPAARVGQVAKLTGIPPHQIRPDLFGQPRLVFTSAA